ncbi:hypothetical protein [Bacillus sp. FSL K6-3431]|uniref:hypothetical protein n=1 Tax=Bacillus sp. FSL K6-3431 TaxID=2921500 RepID=UPI0030F998EB
MSKKPPQHITYGDLVSIDTYDGHLYFVESFVVEHHYQPGEQFTEVWFDLTDSHTGEYMMAEKEDITRICNAAQADDYLMYNAGPPPVTERLNMFDQIFGEVPKMKAKEPRKPTAKEISGIEAEKRKQARKERAVKIDALLDDYNDAKAMVEMFGDEEYRAKVEYLTVKLAEVTAE